MTLTFVGEMGSSRAIGCHDSKNGSTKVPVSTLATNPGNGRVEISADKSGAFALYLDLKDGGYSYAGLSAVDPSTTDTLTKGIKGQAFGSLEVPTIDGLIRSVEELITEAQSFIEKMKAAQLEPAEKGKKQEAEPLIRKDEGKSLQKKEKKKGLINIEDLPRYKAVK